MSFSSTRWCDEHNPQIANQTLPHLSTSENRICPKRLIAFYHFWFASSFCFAFLFAVTFRRPTMVPRPAPPTSESLDELTQWFIAFMVKWLPTAVMLNHWKLKPFDRQTVSFAFSCSANFRELDLKSIWYCGVVGWCVKWSLFCAWSRLKIAQRTTQNGNSSNKFCQLSFVCCEMPLEDERRKFAMERRDNLSTFSIYY